MVHKSNGSGKGERKTMADGYRRRVDWLGMAVVVVVVVVAAAAVVVVCPTAGYLVSGHKCGDFAVCVQTGCNRAT
jgi:hypothetical protein